MLPPEDNIQNLSANVPFSLELQPMDTTDALLDTSAFTTEPFIFDDCLLDVPITDTRQTSASSDTNVQTGINLNVNVGLNTLTSSVNDSSSSSNVVGLLSDDCGDDRMSHLAMETSDCLRESNVIGCSRFNISDWNVRASDLSIEPAQRHSFVKSDSFVWDKKTPTVDGSLGNTNGLIAEFGKEGKFLL